MRKQDGKSCSLNTLEAGVRKSGLPSSETFRGQRVSSWAPPLDKPEKFVVPQDGDVLLAVVAVWSSWTGQPSLNERGQVEQRWLKAARPEWDRLLENAQRGRAATRQRGDEEGQARAAVTAYLERVREVHLRLNLDVLGPSRLAGEQPVIELRQVFIPQDCRPFEPHLDDGVRRRLLAAGELVDELSRTARTLERSARHSPTQPVLSMLAQEAGRRMVVLGDPGAGKSTLAKYLALALAGGLVELPPSLEPIASLVPILVELRQYAQPYWRERTIEDFLDHVHVQERMNMPRSVLEDLLRAGTAVVVFDGLDEIFDPAVRAETSRRITAFAAHYRRVRTVVTSREFGYRSHEFTANGFGQVMLQNLGRQQVEDFIRRWYAAAHPENPQLSSQLTGRLLSAVRKLRPVAELAGNPLLLTILAAIGLGRTIPRERREVYAHAIDVLVERWDKDAKFLAPPAPPTSDVAHALGGLTAGRRLKLLERIARTMQDGAGKPAGTFIHHDDLTGIIRTFLTESNIAPPAAAVAAEQMVEHLRSRNFLLAHYGGGLYGFVHRTFLEYLAATDLLRRREEEEWPRDQLVGLLVEQAQDPAWHEVLLLMSGGLRQRDVAALLARLLQLHQQNPSDEYFRSPMLVLAIKVLAEIDDIGAAYTPGTPDPHLSVAAQSDAVIDALTRALQNSTVSDLENALPALGTFDHFWNGRDRYMRLYWSHVSLKVDYFGNAGAVAAVLSRSAQEAITIFRASRFRGDFFMEGRAILEVLGERWPDQTTVFDMLLYAATDRNSNVRHGALEVLGERWPDRATVFDTLQHAAINDGDAHVRRTALQVLGERWPDRATVLNTLLHAATDKDANVRPSVFEVLGERWPDQIAVFDILLRATTDKAANVRLAALRVLGERWPDRATALDALLQATTDEDSAVRRMALVVLGASWPGRSIVFDALLHAIADEDYDVRYSALGVLGERWPDQTAVLEALQHAVTHEDTGVQQTALVVLGERWPDRTAVFDTLQHATDDEYPEVRDTALRVLGERWPDRTAVFDTLQHAATNDNNANVRVAALRILGERWPDRTAVFDTLQHAATDDEDADVRDAALRILGEHWPDQTAVFDTLQHATDDEDANVRRTALRILGEHWPDQTSAFHTLCHAAADEDTDVRRTALSTLAWRYRDRSCPVLIGLATGEASDELRADLVRVVTLVWPDGPDVPRFLEDRAVDETSEEVRTTAREALSFLHLRSSLGTGQRAAP
ncbi:HEAT repeat domain-containing protein [[Kitasatospora] papulosa]|uniref:HEAT repeat domain-containing protein n=1 Tax=[Kitasatospora] papulosa TaxID=1464011 RepID=UPI0036A720C2